MPIKRKIPSPKCSYWEGRTVVHIAHWLHAWTLCGRPALHEMRLIDRTERMDLALCKTCRSGVNWNAD